MTAFDIIAGLILLVSAITGFVRGAVREMLTVVAFLAAAAIALFALKLTGPIFREMIDPAWLATAVAVLVVFTAAYLLLRLLGAGLTRRLHDHATLGMIDRSIGVGFGLVRAFVILGVFNLLLSAALMGAPAPAWTERSSLFPLSTSAGRLVRLFAPKGSELAGAATRAAGRAVTDGSRDNENRSGSVEKLIENTP